MTFSDIQGMYPINEVDEEKVNSIAESIRENGWVGCPILIYNDQLLTGSHRLAALKKLDDDGEDVLELECAEDVTDIVEENIREREEKNGWAPDIDFGNIGWLLKGSWVETFKSEIAEW